LALLSHYHYPGNVRELNNIVQRSALLSDDELISVEHLPNQIKGLKKLENDTINLTINEKNHITELLNQYGNQPKIIADHLEISVRTLYRKLQKHQLNIKEFTVPPK